MDLYVTNIDEMIIIHGGTSTRQLMKVNLSGFKYLLEHLSICVKIIQMSHKTFQLISRRILKIALEEILYAHVVRICRKSMVQKKDTGKQPKRKYLFQEQSARSKHWFDLDIEWFEEKFSTREPQFYKRLFQSNIEGQSGITYTIFPVPVSNAKETV